MHVWLKRTNKEENEFKKKEFFLYKLGNISTDERNVEIKKILGFNQFSFLMAQILFKDCNYAICLNSICSCCYQNFIQK